MPLTRDGLTGQWDFDNSLASTDRFPLDVPAAAEIVYLIEATVYDPALPGTRVLRYCSGAGYVHEGNYYEPRIKHPGRLKRALFSEGRTSGPGQTGFGEVLLVNTDGGLDALATYGFDGRTLMIKRALALGAALTAVVTLAACGMEQATSTWDEVGIRIKDYKQALNVPLQANKYGGTNALPNGVDGSADLQGKPKPLLYGTVKNATPACVNTARLIYQLHDGALAAISGVYDKGIPLTSGTAYSSQADMEANAPLAGQYRAWLAGGMFRLGATPAGQVTADAAEGATTADRSAAKLAERLAARAIASGDISAADIAALHTANPAVVGYYASTETTVAAALDAVLGSIGAWYGFDALGKLRIGRLDAPAGNPVATLTEAELLSIERLPTSDEGRGLPVWRVNLGYDKNWSTAAVTSDIKALSPWQSVSLPTSAEWGAVAFGNGMFVATIAFTNGGGTSTSYATSIASPGFPLGRSWTSRTFPVAGSYRAIAFGGSSVGPVFVALDDSGNKSMSSADAINWTQGTLPAGIWVRIVPYGAGFLAVGNGTAAAYSADGVTWTGYTLPYSANWSDLKHCPSAFLLLGNGAVYRSVDAINWTAVTMPAGSWRTVYFDGTNWWSQGSSGGVAVVATASAAGSSWSYVEGATGLGLTDAAIYGEGSAVVSRDMTLYVSDNHLTWTPLRPLVGSGYLEEFAYGNGSFVALDTASGRNRVATWSLTEARDRAQWLANPHRTVTASNAAIQTIHPLARELSVETLIVLPAAAQAEADRLLALHSVDRVRLQVKVPRAQLPADLLGKPVLLQVPRYDYSAGKLLLVIGTEEDCAADTLTLDLWG